MKERPAPKGEGRSSGQTTSRRSDIRLARSSDPYPTHGGHLVGATVLARWVAADLHLCECCSHLVAEGQAYLMVRTLAGEIKVCCVDCGPRS